MPWVASTLAVLYCFFEHLGHGAGPCLRPHIMKHKLKHRSFLDKRSNTLLTMFGVNEPQSWTNMKRTTEFVDVFMGD